MWAFMENWRNQNNIDPIWQRPIVRFADALDARFESLKSIVLADHHIPTDFLPQAKAVLSYFIPFAPFVGQSNRGGEACSATWANAYLETNSMGNDLNHALVHNLQERGITAAVPFDADMISLELPMSLWSQRHVAYIAGHGTFGLNNMLISDVGCVGRYFSIVTALDIPADPTPDVERCLYKRNGQCGICISRCPTGALQKDGFNRYLCLTECLKNEARFPGADVCGKCIVELPCSRKIK